MSKVKHIDHKDFEIPFSGLKTGVHIYHFDLGEQFFETNNLDSLKKASIQVEVALDKKPNMLQVQFSLTGEFPGSCDRCGDDLLMGISSNGQHIFKFGQGESQDDEVSMLSEQEHRVNVEKQIYEFCFLAIPQRQTCSSSKSDKSCNQEVIDRLEALSPGSIDDNIETDPRWDILKGLNE